MYALSNRVERATKLGRAISRRCAFPSRTLRSAQRFGSRVLALPRAQLREDAEQRSRLPPR